MKQFEKEILQKWVSKYLELTDELQELEEKGGAAKTVLPLQKEIVGYAHQNIRRVIFGFPAIDAGTKTIEEVYDETF